MFFIRLPTTMSAPCLELGHEPRDLREVVGEVGVRHQDVAAPRDGEPRHVGAPVAALGLVHDERARAGGEPGAAVLGVVVRDDDLARDGVVLAALDALRTQRSIVSSSFRHGITTDTVGAFVSADELLGSGCCRSIVLIRSRAPSRRVLL